MKRWYIYTLLVFAFFTACKDKKVELPSAQLADYWKPAIGKYIVYRIDSTVTTNFGTGLTTHSYRVKDFIDAEITDGLGRKAFRVIRTITDTNGVAPYTGNATFMIIPVNGDWIEQTDDNLRFMKLRWPVQEGFSWKGNSFIDVTSIESKVRYLADWNYTYQNVAQPYTVFGRRFDSTVTVLQRDELIPEGPFDPNAYKQRNYGIEIYAKGVGLVYKEFLHYIYQPPTPGRSGYYEDESYGVKLQVIEHN